MRSFVREIWHHEDKIFARGLLIFFGMTIVFYIGLLLFAVGSGQYSFVHDDEFNYVGAAKLFAETGSVRAPLCMMEEVSKIFGANWYGVSYNVFYGTLYYIFGEHNIIFILSNFAFLILLSLLISRICCDYYKKLFALQMLLFTYPCMVYSFMFFPEILHMFLAFVQFFFLYRIYQIHSSGGNYTKHISLFIVLSVLFSLFRVTSVFWIAGILPFSKGFKQFALRAVVFALALGFILAYMHYFIAPAFVFAMGSIDALKQFDMSKFYSMWIEYSTYNLNYLTTVTVKEPQAYILLFLFSIAAYKSFRKKGKLFLAATLISICYFAALISFYNTYSFYFTKQTAMVYLLLVCVIAFDGGLQLRKLTLLALIVSLPFTIDSTLNEIKNRKISGESMTSTFSAQAAEVRKISSLIDQDQDNLIEFVSYEHKFPRYIFYDALPMSNDAGFPVTYTASVYNESLYPDADYNSRFPLYGRQKVSYVIARDSLFIDNLELIYHSPYYNLYKDNR